MQYVVDETQEDAMTEPAGSPDKTTWLDRPVSSFVRVNWETALYAVFFIAAVLTRFWDLGARALSHDESLHAYYSWQLYRGEGFAHTPLMHGTLRFHLNALFFALLGADDFTSRVPAALFGIALVMSPLLLRRWLGRRGALLASFFLLISPSILYHHRYIRDEPFMLTFGVLLLWAVLSYFGDRKPKWLLVTAVLMALMYTTMEAAFIYVAIFGAFVVLLMVSEIARAEGWGRRGVAGAALALAALVGVLVAGVLIGASVLELTRPSLPQDGSPIGLFSLLPALLVAVVFGLAVGVATFFALRRLAPAVLRQSAGANMAVILGGLSLLMLSAGMLLLLNWQPSIRYEDIGGVNQIVEGTDATVWGLLSGAGNQPFVDPNLFEAGIFPTDAINTFNMVRLFFLFACFVGSAMGLGLWWNVERWLTALGAFGGISVTLFTTMFTNGLGLGTGFIGSLLYWLAQHKVNRGSQPLGYYLFITPFYDYLPMILAAVALTVFGWRLLKNRSTAPLGDRSDASAEFYVPLLMLWTVGAWIGFSIAGEKMPWLMVHLALPMILLGARWVGERLDGVDWRGLVARREWLGALLVPVLALAALSAFGSLGTVIDAVRAGTASPSLEQLNALGGLLSGLLVSAAALAGLYVVFRQSDVRAVFRAAGLAALAVLSMMTIRTAWIFSYVDYDYPTEFGVFAHGGPGLKVALSELEQLSLKLTGTPNEIEVLYDSEATWPWLWYLRDFPNKRFINSTPSRSDASLPVLILSDDNWSAVDQAVGSSYTWSQFHRIWWPTYDYNRIPEIAKCPDQLTLPDGTLVRYAAYDENADGAIDPQEFVNGDARCNQRTQDLVRAVWDIFFFRDYTLYARLTGQQMTRQNWPFQEDFRLYVRKDLAAKVWDQVVGDVVATGGAGAPQPLPSDPYQSGWRDVAAARLIGSAGSGDGQFLSPHGIARAPDDSIYVADSNNHRVIKFDEDGAYLLSFGTWSGEPPNSDLLNPDWSPPDGTFYEPWDVAVGPDGSVYVADLWNSRVQKFDANGKFVTRWGGFGDSSQQAVGAEGRFFGPRGIAVSPDGQRIYVADTGNKRVQVFDPDGRFITQFGGGGLLDGNLDEPVGVAVNSLGEVLVADTWNGRVQVFNAEGRPLRKWTIEGWLDLSEPDLGQSRVGKPYLGLGPDDRVYVSDQAGNRVLVFDAQGQYVGAFGKLGAEESSFSAPSGIAVDESGRVFLVDTGNGRVMVFPPFDPTPIEEELPR